MIKIHSHSKKFEKFYENEIYIFLHANLTRACTEGMYKVENGKKLYFKNDKKIISVLSAMKNDLKNIIIANVNELRSFGKTYNVRKGKTYKKTKKTEEFKLYAIVYKIFVLEGYEYKISKQKDKKLAYDIVNELNLKSCPYCNRNFITSISRNKNNYDKTTRPQLDHFISKSKFPFLACSLYNLIPSCSTCNLLKSDSQDDNLISPYEMDCSKLNFRYKLTDKFEFGTSNLDTIKLDIEGDFESNKKAFLLEELYESHKDIVIDILNKNYQHPVEYITHLYDFKTSDNHSLISINDVFKSLYSKHLNNEEIFKLLYNTELKEDDFIKRPLSKLTYDILKQLNIVKSDKVLNEDLLTSTSSEH